MIFCPLPGTPLVTQGFGQNPKRYVPFGLLGHNGFDFGVPVGTTVYAPHDGRITIKDEADQGYGLSVTIDDGKRRSILAHLSSVSVENSRGIHQGDPIGKSGATGNVTGPHLHWTFKILKNGNVQNADNGYSGAMDVSEVTRLWEDRDVHHDAQFAETAQEYLSMIFASNQSIKRVV